MNARLLLAPALGLTLAVCAGCGGQPLAPKLPIHSPTAPDHIVLAGVPLAFTTHLWRDFMPFSPPDGRPLAAVFEVRSTDGSPLPSGLTITGAGVYYQGESWVTTPEQVVTNDPSLAEAVSRGGPKWGPGVAVDVVVTVSLGGHQRTLMGARDQLIGATY